MDQITTVEGAINALGGVYKAAKALGLKPNAVGNWQTRKRIPSDYFLTVSAALDAVGKRPSPEIFGLKQPIEVAL
jgi:hypothetical protein